MTSTFNPSTKAARLRSAAAEVVCEIYEYRCRVSEYTPQDRNFLKTMAQRKRTTMMQGLSSTEDAGVAKGEGVGNTESEAASMDIDGMSQSRPQNIEPRESFRQRLHEIHSGVMASDMNTDALADNVK